MGRSMMLLATSVLGRAGEALGAFIPRLGGALALLLIGLLITRLIGRVLRHALQAAGLDRIAERSGAADLLERSGLGRSLAGVVARAVRIGLVILVVFAALSLLGLQFLSGSLNQAINDLPKLFIAAILILAGAVLGGAARGRADRLTYQLDLPVPLGQVAQIGVLAIFGMMA